MENCYWMPIIVSNDQYLLERTTSMPTILITDDSGYQRNVLRKALVKENYDILEAANGKECLAIAAGNQPLACIVLDLLMPEMDGQEVLQALHDKGINVPVVVNTVDIQENTRQRCMELGAVAFLNKPIKADKLREVVRNGVEGVAHSKEPE
jgi:CheY-like chemotaxis protein